MANLFYHLDVKTTFLNDELTEEVYIKQLEGLYVKGQEGKVCRLQKVLYGSKDLVHGTPRSTLIFITKD